MQKIEKEYTSIKNNKIIEHAADVTGLPNCDPTSLPTKAKPNGTLCVCPGNDASNNQPYNAYSQSSTVLGMTVPGSSTYYCN